MNKNVHCWCGNRERLSEFSDEYAICHTCHSLISISPLSEEELAVVEDGKDFYGKGYWHSHQTKDLGFPDISQRARQDMANRDIYWLNSILNYKLPPGKTLELGSAHGGFVAMMKSSGFDAYGLELSPWVVDFAKRTFNINMLLGPVEDQALDKSSFDVIILLDVLEHLPDPKTTLLHCLGLLKRDGVLLIQTPNYPYGTSYEEMKRNKDPFLEQLKANEHLHLFSIDSIRFLFREIGVPEIIFNPPLFAYDMFFVAARADLEQKTIEVRDKQLMKTVVGRLILALLDLYDDSKIYKKASRERLEVIEVLDAEVQRLKNSANIR